MGRFVAVGWNEQSPESDRRRQKRALSDVRRASQQSGVERHSVMQYSHHHGRGHGSRIRTVSCANQQGHVIDREQMPEGWPTDHIPSEFWEEYGKAVGAFGVLEDTLKRAYLKITGTRGHKFQTEEQTKEAVAAWGRELEKSLNESLGELIRRITKAIRADDRYPTGAGATLEQGLKSVAEWRNALCHGSWVEYDKDTGVAILRYWKGKGWRQGTKRDLSKADLVKIRELCTSYIFDVVDAVTHQGHQFPGDVQRRIQMNSFA